MNRMSKGQTLKISTMVVALVAMLIGLPIVPGFQTAAEASDAGAFVGGMVAAHVIGGAVQRDKVRTAAAVETANNSRQAAPAPAAAAPQTQEQKMKQLDKLAAGGYITKDEYKARKKAIVDGN